MQQSKKNVVEYRRPSIKKLAIFKYANANQYVVQIGGNQVNFILEEDAQRFARVVSQCPMELPVQVINPA